MAGVATNQAMASDFLGALHLLLGCIVAGLAIGLELSCSG